MLAALQLTAGVEKGNDTIIVFTSSFTIILYSLYLVSAVAVKYKIICIYMYMYPVCSITLFGEKWNVNYVYLLPVSLHLQQTIVRL